jgi:hypothetical protein
MNDAHTVALGVHAPSPQSTAPAGLWERAAVLPNLAWITASHLHSLDLEQFALEEKTHRELEQGV